jgi:hypothetical protein
MAVAMVALPGAAAPFGDSHGPRTVQGGYVAGGGDLVCLPMSGLGCVRFLVQTGETQVQLTVRDDVVGAVGADACSIDCNNPVRFCVQGTLTGLRGGDLVTVFITELTGPAHCGLPALGAGVRGTITAVFT